MTLRVQGLIPNTSYGVNVHNLACSNEAGGGHYQQEVGGAVDNINEMWQVMTTRSNGYGYSRTVNDFVARSEARSVVIHSTDDTSLACVDLSPINVSPYTFGTTRIEELASINAMTTSWDQAKRLSNPDIAVSPSTLGTMRTAEELAAINAMTASWDQAKRLSNPTYALGINQDVELAAFYTNETNVQQQRALDANAARYTGLAAVYAAGGRTTTESIPVDLEDLRLTNPNYFHPGR